MFNIDLFFIILACLQPFLIGLLVICSFNSFFYNIFFFTIYNNLRSKVINLKLYECATNSRLNSKFIYNIYNLSTCVLFIVYDVDLIFFLAEFTNFFTYDIFTLCIFLILLVLLVLGLFVDSKLITLNWKI